MGGNILKKWFFRALCIYFLYILAIGWYLFFKEKGFIPAGFEGTVADPQTFMNPRQLELSNEYSTIKNFIFFLVKPFEWLIFLFVLIFGLSRQFRTWSENSSKSSILRISIYVFWLSLFTTIIQFPINWIQYTLSKSYGVAASSFPIWMKDLLIDFWINYLLMIIVAGVMFFLIRKSPKRWWLYTWLLSVPFSVFIMFLQPVIIAPLYNDFYPLKDKALEEKILRMAEQAGVPANHVYEVNMSEKTNALNAYVTGIGSNSRIVLWDTTLNKLNDDEVLFVMAHEIAHYVKKHIYIGMAGYLLISLLGLYLTSRIYDYVVNRWKDQFGIDGKKDIAALPLILLIFSILSFASSPFSNAVSRYQEHAADAYAINMTEDKDAAISAFQKLTVTGLSQVHPPTLVKIFRYGHPTMLERLIYLEEYKIK